MARYDAEGSCAPESAQKAPFRIGTQQVLGIYSPITHASSFTLSLSLFVTFTDTSRAGPCLCDLE
ncbi:hypothetical protein FBZ92_11732 [Nitrospirillum viridazoti]|uniref:Uncharacterized protein n=1 Tax=Nitrospirillum amazonense TaxID=28077 RepID=A0A560I1J2_9PROT|nr:hypothetical protein FBZ92_11732 [Nitrospirillum amazonense]